MTLSVAEQLKLSDFDYALPEALIAQAPAPERDRSRLMILDRKTGDREHRIFYEIRDYLHPGDLLVLNDTKVFPCRIIAKKTGGGKAEIFLLSERGLNLWDALIKGISGKGKKISISPGVDAEIEHETDDGVKTVRFIGVRDVKEILHEIGRTPLPPYIKRDAELSDRERYQTVYAAHEGAVAAPTAGLHFTHELLTKLRDRGVETVYVTLHVGPGTFQPVRVDAISAHRMLPEQYDITAGTAGIINRAKAEGRRVIAVGTTSVRTLESAASKDGKVVSGTGSTDLFIHPGHEFRATDGIITNFHLPRSTLIMLVSAFAGRENILSAYRAAIAGRYRFYSYGDAMVIL